MVTYMTINAMPQKDTKPVNELVGQNVRLIAQMRGKSQVELALTLGVDATSMSRRINGRTDWSPDEMQKVASLLDVKVWRLFEPLPDLDSNQEPTHSEIAAQEQGELIDLGAARKRRTKAAASAQVHEHTAIVSAIAGRS